LNGSRRWRILLPVKKSGKAATILYMTGTGNTRRATTVISDRLTSKGWDVVVRELRQGAALPPLTDGSLLVLAYPVLAYGVPALVRKLLRGFKAPARSAAGRSRAAVFATMGGQPLAALWQGCRLLREKGFSVIAAGGGAYPFNWTQALQPPGAAEVKSMLREGDKAAADFADLLLQGGGTGAGPDRPRVSFAQVLAGLPIAFLYSTIGRFALAGMFTADEKCTACGECASDCPAGTMAMAGNGAARRPYWKVGCQGCNRCINLCPARAIQSSPLRAAVNVVINVVLLVALVIGLNGLAAVAALPSYITVPLWIVLFLVGLVYLTRLQLAALEPLLFRLESIPAVRRLSGRSWTTGYRRYSAPPR
jgi:Pyruvate/2-oxoacid:ferredoxin oxidoreductase delta subunit